MPAFQGLIPLRPVVQEAIRQYPWGGTTSGPVPQPPSYSTPVMDSPFAQPAGQAPGDLQGPAVPGEMGFWTGTAFNLALCLAAGHALSTCLDWQARGPGAGAQNGGSGYTGSTQFGPGSCPTGYRWDNGECVKAGVEGVVERTLPYGETGTLPGPNGRTAVAGAFNMPAYLPFQVGTITKKNGETGPILRCGPRMVLGEDDLCYMKASLPVKFRKWRPDPRPPVTAADKRHITKAENAKDRVKKLAQASGFTCKKKK